MKHPSILFITTDEQHLDTAYRRDMPYRLDALHALMGQSDVYTRAYSASPVCLPARCAWMGGMLPHRSGCISNNFGASMPLQQPNLFTRMKQNGYTTSMHGKCHFVPCPYPAVRHGMTQEYGHFKAYYKALGMDRLDVQDDKYGSMWFYDDYATEMESKGLHAAYRDRFFDPNAQPEAFPEFPHAKELHPDSWVGQKALEQLDRCAPNQPHFMWVSFSAPHYPMDAPSDYFARIDMDRDIPRRWREGEWDDPAKIGRHGWFGTGVSSEGSATARDRAQKNFSEDYWREWRKRYYANIVQADDYIGAILQKARALWGEDLCVVFTSDHGDMMGNHGLWGKNTLLYDDVLRVPLVVHKPGQQHRRDVSETVSSVDVFPTLLTLAGCELPSGIDGKPLRDIEAQGGRDVIFSSCEGRVAVIKNNMKLCVHATGFEIKPDSVMSRELYDLENDPHEFLNVYDAPAYRKAREELEALLNNEPRLLRTVFYQRGDAPPYWFKPGK